MSAEQERAHAAQLAEQTARHLADIQRQIEQNRAADAARAARQPAAQ